ncbi:unnamed protein product [Rotaria sp. Silwood2]|nr:unnamed protein product [Rotaria sp. Silwood2]CAF2957906.1 unnamed protein product [Rotaria sp. Silwood2]CAF3228359.1 unnamed protein product [Rotaria sp. Silwood2]CAF3339106.1 unnamed protein product [Rotaria sp. Silwood2]CAF3991435.1 unnamed protein product [Rotaria sp. Silwood2]
MLTFKWKGKASMWNHYQSIPLICIGKKIPLLSRKPTEPLTSSLPDANNYSITLPMTRLFALDSWAPYLAHYPDDHRPRRSNKESTTLIWLDLQADDEDKDGELIERLRTINDFSLIYHNLDVCYAYVQSVNTEKVLLITSHAIASTTLPTLIDLVQLNSVFIFHNTDNVTDPGSHAYSTTTSKVVGSFNEWTNLEKAIMTTTKKLRKHLDLFTYLDKNQISVLNVTEHQAEFLW